MKIWSSCLQEQLRSNCIKGLRFYIRKNGVDIDYLFAFQLPPLDAEPAVTLRNSASTQYTFSASNITNRGYRMYMTSSHNLFRTCIAFGGDKTNQFHTLLMPTTSFPRLVPSWLSPSASVVLSSSPLKPVISVGATTNIMVGYTFDMKEMYTVASSSRIQMQARVSPHDDRVYCV